jgi:hypothetical protein
MVSRDASYNDPRLVSSKIFIPALPFPLASSLVVLYFSNGPANCAYQIPMVALIIGALSIFISIVSLTSQCLIHDAWVDQRLTKREHSMLWMFIIQNRILVMAQVLMFFGFFAYLMSLFNTVQYTNTGVNGQIAPNYCQRNIYLFCTVLSGVMVFSGLVAAAFYALFRVIARR